MEPFDDENIPLYTVGQVADMLSLKQAFLRRIDDLQVVSPRRAAGRQRRYTRIEIRVIQQVATMADEGMTLPAIRRIIELEQQLAAVARQRDELAARLSEVSSERMRLAQQLSTLLRRAGHGQAAIPQAGTAEASPERPAAGLPALAPRPPGSLSSG
jgi:DNA-binding transcriptional MerR regulator